jgi:hypothetical protein
MRVEQPLASETWREEKTERTWVKSGVRPVMYVTDPYAVFKLTGMAPSHGGHRSAHDQAAVLLVQRAAARPDRGADPRPGRKARFYQKLGYKGETVDLYPADAARGDKHDVFLADGESLEAPSTEALRLNDIGLLSDEQLALMWEDKAPKVADLLQAVGENPELAQRVLDAENKATDGDPRATLQERPRQGHPRR